MITAVAITITTVIDSERYLVPLVLGERGAAKLFLNRCHTLGSSVGVVTFVQGEQITFRF